MMTHNSCILSLLLIFSVMSYSIAEVVECHVAGYFCGPTCKTFFHCIDLGGELVLDNLFTCGANEFCNVDTRSCSSTPDHCAPAREFECVDVWRFPFPHSCTSYVECSSDNQIAYKDTCSNGFIYDPCAHNCVTGSCSVSVPVCNRIFQSGLVPNTDNKFYVCNEELYPEQYSCGDLAVDRETFECTKTPSKCIP